jgi:DNA mismatch endonuclease (patch repair protein)
VDTVSLERRSEIMSRVRSRDTKPEMVVRRLVHGLGYRYRLHKRDVPGKPDLVFKSRKKAIFVHGCFWHRHEGCPNTRTPKSRVEFWERKFFQNQARDKQVRKELDEAGWNCLVIWECQVKDIETLTDKIVAFLEGVHEID